MKRLFLIALAVLTVMPMLFLPSCNKSSRVEDMLSYLRQTPTYDVTFCVGESEYPMKITLGEHTGEFPLRDGEAVITSGALEGVSFLMSSSVLTMRGDGFEYEIGLDGAEALCALFAAFGIEASSFADLTQDDVGRTVARFDGKYVFTLVFDKGDEKPREITVDTGNLKYILKFKL